MAYTVKIQKPGKPEKGWKFPQNHFPVKDLTREQAKALVRQVKEMGAKGATFVKGSKA